MSNAHSAIGLKCHFSGSTREFRARDFQPPVSKRSRSKPIALLGWTIVLAFILWIGYDAFKRDAEFLIKETVFDSQGALSAPLKIVFLSDLHLRNSDQQFERMKSIVDTVGIISPDLILLGGDFSGENSSETSIFRDNIVAALKPLTDIAPTYTVLGNHEWWTADNWSEVLSETGIIVIENQQRSLAFKQGRICLRGLGDAYTGHYRALPFGNHCKGIKVTLTYDPLAIERDTEQGLYLAGHTHCGQIRLPIIGAPWIPTSASDALHCGTGSSDNKVWLVSSGLGTSVINARLGTNAAIESITLR